MRPLIIPASRVTPETAAFAVSSSLALIRFQPPDASVIALANPSIHISQSVSSVRVSSSSTGSYSPGRARSAMIWL